VTTAFVIVQAVAFALFGLVVGSFLTVVVYRVPRGESVIAPRSRCPSCGAPIRARDNIPVVSWVLLRGKCRACKARIAGRYPLTELANGALWVAASVKYGDDIYTAVVVAVFFSLLLAVSLIDLEHKIIPNHIVYPAVPFFAALLLGGFGLGRGYSLVGAAIGFLAYGGGLVLVSLLYPRGMGMGDGKLAALVGLVLGALGGRLVAVAAALAFFLGGLGGVAALSFGKAGRKQAIPFGPFIAAGAVLSALFGVQIADWYLSFFR